MNYEKKLKLQNMYFPEGGNGNLLDLILLLYQAGRRMKTYIYTGKRKQRRAKMSVRYAVSKTAFRLLSCLSSTFVQGKLLTLILLYPFVVIHKRMMERSNIRNATGRLFHLERRDFPP